MINQNKGGSMILNKIIRHVEIELMRHEDHLKSEHVHSSQKEWVRGNISALKDVLETYNIYKKEMEEV
jgi:hypothetical protein